MKTLILLIMLFSFTSQAENKKFVDIAYFDTKVITTLGESSFSGKGCTIVLYGPSEGEINSNTISGKSCRNIVQSGSDSMKEKGIGITSIMVNGVETLKRIQE